MRPCQRPRVIAARPFPTWTLLALSLGVGTLPTLQAANPLPISSAGVPGEWIDLCGSLRDRSLWQQPTGEWYLAENVAPDPHNPRRLKGEPGSGILVNGPTGRTSNLYTARQFGDVELECEFMVPRGSNSGIKFNGIYEIQIFDSHGKQRMSGSDCGGIYPRSVNFPSYLHIDRGYAPAVNAARPPGAWQSLRIVFRSPRIDASGRKVAPACFEKVELNGQVIHQNQVVPHPTGSAWMKREPERGPIMLQADHGPVAFRNLRVRRLD